MKSEKPKPENRVGSAHHVGQSPTYNYKSRARSAHKTLLPSPERRRVAQIGQGISARTV
jgi:hypothetical protein